MPAPLLSTLYFVAFSHAVMITIVLWRRSGRGAPARLLAVLSALMAYKLFEGGALYSGLYRLLPHTLDLLPGVVLVIGPVLFAYVRRMTGRAPLGAGLWVLHLLPAALMWLYNAPDVIRPAAAKIAMWDAVLQDSGNYAVTWPVLVRLVGMKLHLATYLALAWRGLDRFAPALDQLRADHTRDVLARMRHLLIAFIALETVWVGLFLAQPVVGIVDLEIIGQVWLLLIAAMVIAIGFQGLQTPNFLMSEEEKALARTPAADPAGAAPEPAAKGDATVKYLHSALPETAAAEIAALIETRLREDRLYLDERLSLTGLARAIDLKPHTVSQVVNQYMKSNFYRLINGYRVQHAVTLIEDTSRSWPLERIAIESGFTNRVTFNKAFKDALDCTASQYRDRLRRAS